MSSYAFICLTPCHPSATVHLITYCINLCQYCIPCASITSLVTVVCLTITSVTPARVKKFITHSSQLIYFPQYLMHEYLPNEQEKQVDRFRP